MNKSRSEVFGSFGNLRMAHGLFTEPNANFDPVVYFYWHPKFT